MGSSGNHSGSPDSPRRSHLLRAVRLAGGALAGSLLVTTGAFAQTVGQTASAMTQSLDEIVVTALKREQRLEDVPASISVLSADQIQKMGAVKFDDYARLIPGLIFTPAGPGANTLTLRGIPNIGNTTSTVGFYVDDVLLTTTDGRSSASNPLASDIDHIEVLRGPQGTLYGAGAMGGVVRVITKKPDTDEFSAQATTEYSSTRGANNYLVNGTLNLPLGARAALRVNAVNGENGGYIDRIPEPTLQNVTSIPADVRAKLARGASDFNTEYFKSFRGQMLFKLTDNITLTPVFQYQDVNQPNQPYIDTDHKGNYQGFVNQHSVQEYFEDFYKIFSLTAEIDVGFGKLISSTGYQDRAIHNNSDFTNQAIGIFHAGLPTGFTAGEFNIVKSHETRFVTNFPDSRWSSITGVAYNELTDHANIFIRSPGFGAAAGLPAGVLPNDLFFSQVPFQYYRQFALFEDLSYKFAEQWTATLGLRVFTDNSNFYNTRNGLFVGPTTSIQQGASNDTGHTPKAAINYKPSENTLIYLSVAEGFRPGGSNLGVASTCAADLAALGLTSAPTEYKPDSLWNHELGVNSGFFDGQLNVRATIFDITWTDIQLNQSLPCGFNFRHNSGKASSKGGELQLSGRPFAGLTLSGGLSYAKAQIDKADPGIPFSKAGDQLPGVPKLTYDLTADYERPIGGSGWRAYVGGDFSYKGALRTQLGPVTPLSDQTSNRLLDVHLGIRNLAWSINGYVRNATDERFALSTSGGNIGQQTRMFLVTPRTYGVSLTRQF